MKLIFNVLCVLAFLPKMVFACDQLTAQINAPVVSVHPRDARTCLVQVRVDFPYQQYRAAPVCALDLNSILERGIVVNRRQDNRECAFAVGDSFASIITQAAGDSSGDIRVD